MTKIKQVNTNRPDQRINKSNILIIHGVYKRSTYLLNIINFTCY